MSLPAVTIDASAAVRWILDDEPFRAGALALRSSLEAGIVATVQPAHFLLDVGGALDRAVRDRRIEPAQARTALLALEALSFDSAAPMAVAADALDVATRTGLRVPDAAYVVCAARNDARLITADRRMREVGDSLGVPVVDLADLPPP